MVEPEPEPEPEPHQELAAELYRELEEPEAELEPARQATRLALAPAPVTAHPQVEPAQAQLRTLQALATVRP